MSSLFTVTTHSQILELSEYINNNISQVKSIVAFDTEATGPNPIIDTVIGYSISLYEDEGFYVPLLTMTDDKGLCTEAPAPIPKEGNSLDKKMHECLSKESREIAIALLKSLQAYKLLMHNASYDVIICRRNFDVDLGTALYCDTIMLKHTVDCDPPHGLKECGAKYFGASSIEEQTELGGSVIRNGGKWNKTNHEVYYGDLYYVGKYGAMDTVLTLKLFNKLSVDLDSMKLTDFFYKDEVMPLMKLCTINMKDTGFRVDLEHFKKAKLNIQAEIDELERQLQLEVSEVTSHMEDAFLDKTFPPQPIRDFAEAIILEADLPLPLNPKSGSFSLAKSLKKKWVTEVTKDCTAEQLVVIWFIDEQCNKLPTELIRATQRRMWEERDGGYIVNLNSSTQLAKVLYDMWGIRSTETTATGEPSFTASIIQNIAIKRMIENDNLSPSEAEERFEEYMECAKLPDDADWFIKYLRKKKLEKILSTYIDGIMELQINGRIHADFLQFGTNAGRYSLKRPNLQNLPAHSALGEVVKRGYIA